MIVQGPFQYFVILCIDSWLSVLQQIVQRSLLINKFVTLQISQTHMNWLVIGGT